MGVFDKIKNALFEEEYVEVEEKPKKVKKVKPKESDFNDKPIAKKIVLPEKKENRVEELDDEELLDEDFEIPPRKEEISRKEEEKKNQFKIMDEDDFRVDSEDDFRTQPKIIKTEDEDRYNNYREPVREEVHYYQNKPVEREKQPYGIDESAKIKVHEYGTGVYEKKEDKTHFKPSPIISPIYGILDKNYKKEDVVQKKEVRLTSSYSRGKVSVDEVRNKAYGSLSDDIVKEFDEPVLDNSFEVEEDDSLLVDLTIDDDKPSVKEVTMGDALEYFQDLGLEYNVDYVDAGKEKSTGRRAKEHYEEFEVKNEMETNDSVIKEKVKVEIKKEQEITKLAKEETPEDKKETKKEDTDTDLDTDDNLFDLIDSMYQEND